MLDGKEVYMSRDNVREQIYRKLDLLRNLSAVTVS